MKRCKMMNKNNNQRCQKEALPFHDYCLIHQKWIEAEYKRELLKKLNGGINKGEL